MIARLDRRGSGGHARQLDASGCIGYTRTTMTDPSDPPVTQSARSAGRQALAKRRDDLRKAALKANMARRKAQVRGREQVADPVADAADDTDTDDDTRNA